LSIAAPGGNCVNIGVGEPCLYPILTTIDSGSSTPQASTYTDSVDPSVGTSFSSPLVAATAALMFSVQPALTPAGLRNAIRASARPFPSSGIADDPNTGPVPACHAPDGHEQLQCYCSTSTCGAGMLDAGAAVRAVGGVQVLIDSAPTAPIAREPITLTGSRSTVAPGHSLSAWQWSVVDAGGTGSSFSGSTTAATATLVPAAAGTVVVRLVVSDERGVGVAGQQSITVAPAPAPAPASASVGGGGVLGWPWMAGLLLAIWVLARGAARRR